jgi:hypothetical protein
MSHQVQRIVASLAIDLTSIEIFYPHLQLSIAIAAKNMPADPADLAAKAWAELGFSCQLEQP